MEDAMHSARTKWLRRGLGLDLGEHLLTCFAWADDFAASATDLGEMADILKDTAWREAGL